MTMQQIHSYRDPFKARDIPTMPPRVRDALKGVAEAHGITLERLLSREGDRIHYDARKAAYVALRAMDGPCGKPFSLNQIGKWFSRDHTTIVAGLSLMNAGPNARCREHR